MAAPVYQSSGTTSNGTVSTVAADVPTGVAIGDIIIVAFYLDGITATVTGLPTGFAAAPGTPVVPASPMNHQLHIYGKRAIAADADASTYNFTLSAAVFCEWQSHRFNGGRASGSILDTANSTNFNTANSSVSPAVSMSTTEADELLLHAATCWAGGTWTPPTGFTKIMQPAVGLCTLSYKAQAAAGATGSITATTTTSDKQEAWLGAILPVAAAGGRNPGGDALPFFM